MYFQISTTEITPIAKDLIIWYNYYSEQIEIQLTETENKIQKPFS